jgi:hypothetical protein
VLEERDPVERLDEPARDPALGERDLVRDDVDDDERRGPPLVVRRERPPREPLLDPRPPIDPSPSKIPPDSSHVGMVSRAAIREPVRDAVRPPLARPRVLRLDVDRFEVRLLVD